MSAAEVQLFRTSLEKHVASETYEENMILDILEKLFVFPITVEILKTTKIGQVLQEIKSKFADKKAGSEARRLISKWKEECKKPGDKEKEKKVGAAPSSVKKDKKDSPVTSADSESTFDDNDTSYSEDKVNQLPPGRKKIFELLTSSLKINVIEEFASFVAFDIEQALNQNLNFERDQRGYIAKAKTLTFNLKNNEVSLS